MAEDDLNDRERIEKEIARLRRRAAELEETLQSPSNVSSAKFELEERCKQILETASHGICSLDRDFRTLFVNKTMAGMLGYRDEEMLGRSLSDFVVEEERVDYNFQASQRRQGFRG